MKNEIIVSVICTCYNHENFIESALQGFVMQKTNFPFEVLIHDDASSDESAKIIRRYAGMYPDIIRPIYQKENQYSKGVRIGYSFIWPLVRGKYVSLCEGDDYWCDENKLQKQVDFLELNPDFVACTHNSIFRFQDGSRERVQYPKEDCELFLENVIVGGGVAYHTSSLMYRREFMLNRPKWTRLVPGVGDYPLSIFLALSGRIYYIGDVMSVSRRGVPGSWSMRIGANTGTVIETKKNIIKMLRGADEYSDYEYTNIFKERSLKYQYEILCLMNRYKDIREGGYIRFYKEETPIRKVKLWCKFYCPWVVKIWRKLSN